MIKTVFLTGATGNMGWAGFLELHSRRKYNIRILVRDSKKNRKKLGKYLHDSSVTVIWGDLTCFEDVCKGVAGSDYVLHVGGMVSPSADYYPEKTLKVNVEAAENVVNAVLAQPNAADIKVVYIGSVAQYGDKNPPNHWGDVTCEQVPAKHDMYALSKIRAEEIFASAGLAHWVSLRQTAILYPGIFRAINPTAFHVPMGGVLEWVTIEDSGRILAQVCEDWVPEEFWNRAYNISSGKEYRMTNYDFMTLMLSIVGLPKPEKVFEPQWFALKNFHGMWFTDADVLENYLHFRANVPAAEYFASIKSQLPWFYYLAFLAPAWAVKMFMKPYAYEKGMGTQWWVDNDQEKFLAYYGSREAYDSIRSWDDIRPTPLSKNPPVILNGSPVILNDPPVILNEVKELKNKNAKQ